MVLDGTLTPAHVDPNPTHMTACASAWAENALPCLTTPGDATTNPTVGLSSLVDSTPGVLKCRIRRLAPNLSSPSAGATCSVRWICSALPRPSDQSCPAWGFQGLLIGRGNSEWSGPGSLSNRSSVGPSSRDWRFKNRAWEQHPLYRRVGRAYLAWTETLLGLVDDADLDWRTDELARFVLNNLTAALAPTNFFLLNPDACERAFETAGRSVLRGWRNIGRDLLKNHGRPRTVDRSAFELGRNLAATPGAVVFHNEVCELIQYTPRTEVVWETPVVVVPPQINKYYVMDLSPGRSFVEYAVERGFQAYAVSWRNPIRNQSRWDLNTYVRALHEALGAAAEVCSSDSGKYRRGVCRRVDRGGPARSSCGTGRRARALRDVCRDADRLRRPVHDRDVW